MPKPITGTHDFFYEASAQLVKGNMPHIMLAKMHGSSLAFRSYHVHSREELETLKEEIMEFIEMIEEEFEEGE